MNDQRDYFTNVLWANGHLTCEIYRSCEDIEDIIWPGGDKKFLFESWKVFHEWATRMGAFFE